MRRLALMAALLAGACVPVPTPTVTTVEARPDSSLARLRPGEVVAVAVRDADDPWSADCVHERLATALPENRLIAPEATRDAFFPWLEIGEVPQDDGAVEAFLARAPVTRKLADMQLRYLFLVDHEGTISGGHEEQVFVGMAGAKVVERVSVTAVDPQDGCCRSGGSASAAGIQGYAHVLIYGVIVLSFTETAACHAVADGLIEALRPAAATKAGAAP